MYTDRWKFLSIGSYQLMTDNIKRGHKFYLIAALLLLMQTFSVWHDSTHPFHIASVQCEQMAAVEHNSTKPSVPLLLPSFIVRYTERLPIISPRIIGRQLSDNHSIRAPPVFS